MIHSPLKRPVEIPTFMLHVEVWPRCFSLRDPVVSEYAYIGVAHELLAEDLDAVIYYCFSLVVRWFAL